MRRRTLLTGLVVGASAGLAGCGGNLPGPIGGQNGSGTPRQWDVDGDVTESSVEGLQIADHEASIPHSAPGVDQPFGITVTLENTGDRRTDGLDYDFSLALFDEDGTDITPDFTAKRTVDSEISPGDTGEILIFKGRWGDDEGPDDVARYELSMACEYNSDGIYCDESSF